MENKDHEDNWMSESELNSPQTRILPSGHTYLDIHPAIKTWPLLRFLFALYSAPYSTRIFIILLCLSSPKI